MSYSTSALGLLVLIVAIPACASSEGQSRSRSPRSVSEPPAARQSFRDGRTEAIIRLYDPATGQLRKTAETPSVIRETKRVGADPGYQGRWTPAASTPVPAAPASAAKE